MSWFACRVEYEMEYKDGKYPPCVCCTESDAFEADDAERACERAMVALKPYGRQWTATAWEAVECRDREEAEMTAVRMREWSWRADR